MKYSDWVNKIKDLSKSIASEADPDVESLKEELEGASTSEQSDSRILTKAASFFLKNYKKTFNTLVDRYRPPFSVHLLVTQEAIDQTLALSENQSFLSTEERILLASQGWKSLDLAIQLLKKANNVNDSSLSTLLEGLDHWRSNKKQEAKSIFEALARTDSPVKRHPLVARAMVEWYSKNEKNPAELKKWVHEALYFFPIEKELVKLSISLEDKTPKLQKQLLDLIG